MEKCQAITNIEGTEERHYIEITMHFNASNTHMVFQDPIKKPRIRCDNLDLAKSVSTQINYAKSLYVERLLTLARDNMIQSED